MARSSFSIRRLISPRPSPTVEEYRHSENSHKPEDFHLSSTQQRQQEANTWPPPRHLSNSQPGRPSREDVPAQNSQSTKRIPSGAPRLQGSLHSPSSSLYSCEYPTGTAQTTAGDGTLCCSQTLERKSRPSAPKRLAERRHLWISPLSPPYDSVTGLGSTEADIKAREAGFIDISFHPALRGTLTPPDSPEEEEYGSDQWSPNVEHLIQETDEAFKAVGAAIEEAKMAVSNFPSPTDVGRTSTSSAPSLFQQDSPKFPHRELQGRNSTPAASSGFDASMPSAPNPTGDISKKPHGFSTTAEKSARWQLGEDIINGHIFRKVEVDELLTPDRLESLRLEREAPSQPRRSSETLKTTSTDDSETPHEPFHLQDLPSRIGAAGVKMAVLPADVVVPPSPLDSRERLEATLKKKSSRRKKPVNKEENEGEGPLANGEVSVPPPPAKNPARFLTRPQAPLLPTIPEVVVATPGTGGTPTDGSNKTAARIFASVDEDEFIFFQSTNYTMNHPMFRHGPIRFPRTKVVKGMKLDPDDTLDWTAFQMAILGGAGYLSSDPTDFTQPPENEEAADLASWFDGFCFDSHGILITGNERAHSPKTSPAVPAMLSLNPFTRLAVDSELPIPVGAEYPTGFWNEGAVNVSKIPKAGCGIRRWTMEGHPKRVNRESVGSLPPSPMMDLVMMRDSDGELEVVPMGYNLGHDLEDFLKWEAENVCALGVY